MSPTLGLSTGFRHAAARGRRQLDAGALMMMPVAKDDARKSRLPSPFFRSNDVNGQAIISHAYSPPPRARKTRCAVDEYRLRIEAGLADL